MTLSLDRRSRATRIPGLTEVMRPLTSLVPPGVAIPLLYVEFANLDNVRSTHAAHRFRAACKQATAAALKSSIGTILRRSDLVAAGAGAQWFIALLIGRTTQSSETRIIDADLGIAALRLRQSVRRALDEIGDRGVQPSHVAVRCGWSVFEPKTGGDIEEALRHAIRGAAVVARVEERRGVVLAAITHELRTPLTAIIGFTERLQSKSLNSAQRARALTIIAHEAQRLHRLTEGLIDVGAWNADGLHLRLRSASLRRLAAAAVRQVAARARAAGIAISLRGNASAMVDPDRLLQILVNVLDNAIRHTPAAGSIYVQINRRAGQVDICVHDSGPGFSAVARRNLGAPFNVGANGKIGLGLAICKILAEAHGGQLKVGNGRMKGGMVTVTLPYTTLPVAERGRR